MRLSGAMTGGYAIWEPTLPPTQQAQPVGVDACYAVVPGEVTTTALGARIGTATARTKDSIGSVSEPPGPFSPDLPQILQPSHGERERSLPPCLRAENLAEDLGPYAEALYVC